MSILTLPRVPAWTERASCRDLPLEVSQLLFFEAGHQLVGRRMCQLCPVREDCLAAALEEERGTPRDFRVGVRGGMSSVERARLAKQLQAGG